jgi:hypothetical protein
VNQTTLMNFVPTRPIEDVAREYVDGFWDLYDPQRFLDRAYRHYRILGAAPCHRKSAKKVLRAGRQLTRREVRAFASILVRQGFVRKTRVTFWRYLWQMYRHNPGRVISYLTVCAQIEHFLEYRELVRKQIGDQSAAFTVEDSSQGAPVLVETRSANVASAVSAPLASES